MSNSPGAWKIHFNELQDLIFIHKYLLFINLIEFRHGFNGIYSIK